MEISLRYPPVTGRLHTRYAPVRRSPAVYCYTPLPLDLHVLSLPLAFILSQDQTLHCKNCSLRFTVYSLRFTVYCPPSASYLFDSSSCLTHIQYMYADTRYLFLLIRFKSLSFISRGLDFSTAPFFDESGCKDTTIFQTAKIFFHFFHRPECKTADPQRHKVENFFQKPTFTGFPPPQNSPPEGFQTAKITSRKRLFAADKDISLQASTLNVIRGLFRPPRPRRPPPRFRPPLRSTHVGLISDLYRT